MLISEICGSKVNSVHFISGQRQQICPKVLLDAPVSKVIRLKPPWSLVIKTSFQYHKYAINPLKWTCLT